MSNTTIVALRDGRLMLAKYVSPSVSHTAFNCAHCGALTTQYWSELFARRLKDDAPTPNIYDHDFEVDRKKLPGIKDEEFEAVLAMFEKLRSGEPFLSSSGIDLYRLPHAHNIFISQCFNCKKISVWIYDRMIYPSKGEAPPPNPDLPDHIAADYKEASSILDISPRGAAAIMRLCIQNLCVELGQSGKNINEDIGSLVAAGLDVRVQKALDAVRVIGNNAVHPGQIDLKDDRETAESLFGLLNLIAEKTITEPKHVDEVYGMLPADARAAIAARDAKK